MQLLSIFLIRMYSMGGRYRDLAHYPKWVIALAAAFPFLVLILSCVYYYYFGRFLSVRNFNFSRCFAYLKPLSLEAEEWLGKNNSWYTSLDSHLQKRFKRRMKEFILERKFYGHQMTVEEEMKWCVAAVYAQLTIGIKHPWSKLFQEIVFYKSGNSPSASPTANNSKILYLDWDQFYIGFSNAHDGINEGLRMLARLLKKDDAFRKKGYVSYPFFILDSKEMGRWNAVAKQEFQKFSDLGLLQGQTIGLEDFLSVTMVYFFEMPEKLKERHPDLYKATLQLMHWDPIRKRIV